MENGWKEGLDEVNRIKSQIVGKLKGLMPVEETVFLDHTYTGMIDMGRYIEGDPECFMELQDSDECRKDGQKIVRIVYNCSASAGVNSDVLYKRGAMCLALVDLLEMTGVRVELEVGEGVGDYDNNKFEIRFTVKRSDEALDMDRLAFCIANPDFLRRICFRWEETATTQKVREQFGFTRYGGYGIPAELEDKGDIYFCDAMLNRLYTDEDYAKRLMEELRKQGIAIE
jgi:hypothetical protein